MFSERMEIFRDETRRNDEALRDGGMHPSEWVHARMHELRLLADALRGDVACRVRGVGTDDSLMLAYFDLLGTLRRLHDHSRCKAVVCFARAEGEAWLRFRRPLRERLEALLFPTAWSREWVRDAAVLSALGLFHAMTLPQGPLREDGAPLAARGRIREWALHEERPRLGSGHKMLYGCTEEAEESIARLFRVPADIPA